MAKKIRLDQLAPRKGEQHRVREFYYPPQAPKAERCVVHLKYMSPSLFEDEQEKRKPKTIVNGRERAQEETDVKTLKEAITSEILVKAVVKIEGLTVRKLASMIEMSPEAVKELGGVDEVVPTDPGADDDAKANIQYLLNQCTEFFQFVMDVCSNLSHFQDKTWVEQTKNSESGVDTNSAGT